MFTGNVGLPNIENIIYPDTVKKNYSGILMGFWKIYRKKSVLKTCIYQVK